MRNSKRNGFIKSLTSVIAVVLMLALMLTGCTDKEAQSLANTAQGVADKAQTSADEANKNATSAQDKAESNLAQLTELEKLVMSLPDSEAVATAIANALADYVKGDGALAKDSIVTYEEVNSLLAQYVTAQALEEKLTGVGTDLATLKTKIEEELGKAINKNADDIKTVNAWINGAAATIVASNEFKTAINTALSDYITKTVFDEGIKSVNDKIAALQKLLVGANYDVTSAENLIGQINEDLADLTTKLAAVEAKVDVELKVSEAIAAAKVELESAIKNKYLAATEFIIENDYKFDDLLEEYEAKKNIYNEETYNALIKNINDNRVRFRRSLVVDCGQEHDGDRCCAVKILETVTSASAEQINLAQALAAALDEVHYVNGYVVIEDLTGKDEKSSKTGLAKAKSIIETINAQMTATEIVEYVNSYNDASTGKVRDLKEEVDVLSAEVAKLEAIKTYAADNVITRFTAISNYDATAKNFASIKVDMAKKYLDVDSKRDTLEAEKLLADQALAAYIETQFANDDENPNIERLVTAAAWEQYRAAGTRIGELQMLDAAVTAYVAEISELLTAKAYNVDAGKANYLYSDYETLKALADEVAEWLETYVSVEANYADVITNYNDDTTDTTEDLDLVYAVAYAKAMTDKFTAAHAENGLVDDIDDVLDDDISIDNYDKFMEVYEAYETWKTGVDQKNVEAIIDYVEVATLSEDGRLAQFEGLKLAYDALKKAQEDVVAINKKISDLVALKNNNSLTINTMSVTTTGIRAVRNDIVEWLNAGQIAVPAQETPDLLVKWILKANTGRNDIVYKVDATPIDANWEMLDSEGFLSVLTAYDAIVANVIGEARTDILPLIENIEDSEYFEDYILYLYDDIKNAMIAYTGWVGKYNVEAADLAEYDFGETYTEVTGIIAAQLIALLETDKRLEDTIDAAQADYAEFETLLEEALADSYTVGIMANKIPEAYKKASDWYNEYINATLGFNATIEAYEDILVKKDYEDIVDKYEDYEKLVGDALEDYKVFKDRLDTITVGDYNVYDAAFIQTLVVGNNETLMGAYLLNVISTMSKYGVSGEQTELLATFQSANMDARFKTDADGGVNMVALLEKLSKIYGGPSNVDSYEYFINQLVAEAEGIRNSFDAKFTAPYIVSIYSRKDLKPFRDAYNAWATKCGMTKDTAAYAVDGINGQIAEYIDLLNDINDMDEAIEILEGQKNNETADVIALINGLASIGGADKVTTLNRTQIMTAYKAYNAWYTGDFNKDGDFAEADVYKINLAVTDMYVISAGLKETLDAYYNALDALDDKIDAVEGIVDAIPDDITDRAAYEKAINDANKALDEYYAANGGNTDGIDATVAGAVAEAEMKLAIYDAMAEATAKGLTTDQLEALEAELEAAFKSFNDTFYAESTNPNAPINQFENNKADTYKAIAVNFDLHIEKDILTKTAYQPVVTP